MRRPLAKDRPHRKHRCEQQAGRPDIMHVLVRIPCLSESREDGLHALQEVTNLLPSPLVQGLGEGLEVTRLRLQGRSQQARLHKPLTSVLAPQHLLHMFEVCVCVELWPILEALVYI